MTHEKWLDKTIQMAVENVKNGGGPFAAIVVKGGEVIGSGTNCVHLHNDPSAHAELLAIREACAHLQSTDLSSAVLYASGEPCPMCLGAAYWSNVGQVYYTCSKNDAFEGTGFPNLLENYFPDQQKEPEKRQIPFVHIQTDDALAPFLEWKKTQN